jgi:alanine dehydrogenase
MEWRVFIKPSVLSKRMNIVKGNVTYKAVAEAFDLEYTPIDELL